MTLDYTLALILVAIFAMVQSFFGMGILVFGTPSLLILGYDFPTTLSYLLPASFAISSIQVATGGAERAAVSKYLYLLSLPGICIGLWFAKSSPLAGSLKILIGVTLLFAASIRFWPALETKLYQMIKKQSAIYHLVMGAIHGLTNLGGAFLAVLASGASSDKKTVRYVVAHYYLVFTAAQIAVLSFLLGHLEALISGLPAAIVAVTIYIGFGNRYFVRASAPAFNLALTIFMGSYGLIILLMPLL